MNSISIFGVFVADLCFFGNKIPTRGETVLGNNHLVGPGGKGSNQAIAAARLKGNVKFITKVGKDNYAEMALSIYKEAGVNTESIIQDSNLSTGVAGIMIDENGHNAINIVAGAAGHLQNIDIDKNLDVIKDSKIFLTQMETPDLTTMYALKKAKENNCLTILNPAPATILIALCPFSSIIIPATPVERLGSCITDPVFTPASLYKESAISA